MLKWRDLLIGTFASLIALFIGYMINPFVQVGNRVDLPRLLIFFIFLLALYVLLSLLIKKRAFPFRHIGSIRYNLTTTASKFSVPSIFGMYKSEVFLVGPTQNYVLNIKNDNGKQFIEMIRTIYDAYCKREIKRINVLVSDIRSDSITRMYKEIDSNIFIDRDEIISSIKKYDELISSNFGDDFLFHLKRNHHFCIKCARTFLNSFCFIDQDTKSARGYFILIASKTEGGNRPTFYLDRVHDIELFDTYYNKYKKNIFEHANNILWP
jgi:hypothetical protein